MAALFCKPFLYVNSQITLNKEHDLVFILQQVNPHTHQLKLCDFGSAKVLVCAIIPRAEINFIPFETLIDIFIFLDLTGEGRTKYILYLFEILQSS